MKQDEFLKQHYTDQSTPKSYVIENGVIVELDKVPVNIKVD